MKKILLLEDDIALELNEDFFTLQTSYEEFELDAKAIKNELSNAESVLISFEDDGKALENIKKCMEIENKIVIDDKVLKFGTKSVDKLSEASVIVLFV